MFRTLCAFLMGMREYRSDLTSSVGDDLIETYDAGRDFAHRATMRHWDDLGRSK